MSYSEELEKINALKQEIDPLLPLRGEAEEKLWKKLRLEWNFNSNHIEGNTLTYFETSLFLFLGNTSGDHKAREYDEMKAHDVAIEIVKNWAGDKGRNITEKEIRELNKIILVNPFWKDAKTPDGLSTRREIIPGEYKKDPNNVRLENGEIFWYSSPEEVSPKMKELLDWYHLVNDLHPVVKAALLHYKFVRIHPFDDGNGRVARLLMNYHLIRNGYAPVIIKSSDKTNYIFALNKADVGDFDSFINYIIAQAIWSMSLLLKAAKNESIEEEEDWKKEVSNLTKNISIRPVKRDKENLEMRMGDSILPILVKLKDEIRIIFGPLFGQIKFNFLFNSHDFSSDFEKTHFDMIYNHIAIVYPLKDLEIILEIELKDFLGNGIYVFDIKSKILVDINEFSYTIRSYESLDVRMTKEYTKKINEFEQRDLVNKFGKFIYSQIESKRS